MTGEGEIWLTATPLGGWHDASPIRSAGAAGGADATARVNLILYYGVLAPRAAWRSAMVVATADGVDATDGASSGEPDGDASRESRAGVYNQALI